VQAYGKGGIEMKSLEEIKIALNTSKELMNEADRNCTCFTENRFEYHRGAYDALCWLLEEELKRERVG
jgi:hypothetical protein